MMSERKLFKRLGITPERVKVAQLRTIKLGKVRFLYRPLAPIDFLGEEFIPYAPYREARDRIADDQAILRFNQIDWTDPAQAKQEYERQKKAYRAVFLKSVLWPELSADQQPGKVCVEDLFVDMSVASRLFIAITAASVQKKSLIMSYIIRLLSWMPLPDAMEPSPTRLSGPPSKNTA